MCIDGHATGYLLITFIYFSRSLEWTRLICRWHFQWPAVFIWGMHVHIRQAKTWTIQKQWQYFIKHGSLWTGLAADSCAREKALFESAVAEGNFIAVLQSLVDNLYGSHKGHRDWQKPRCGPWLLQITQLGKGVSLKKLGRRKSAGSTAWETAWGLADEKKDMHTPVSHSSFVWTKESLFTAKCRGRQRKGLFCFILLETQAGCEP